MTEEDPFDSLLTLEDRYYQEGFTQGAGDGARAGRIEGRLFGYETAFAKFVRLGKVHGRAIVLQQRLKAPALSSNPPASARPRSQQEEPRLSHGPAAGNTTPEALIVTPDGLQNNPQEQDTHEDGGPQHILPPLPHPERVAKHVRHLHQLSSPDAVPTQNDEDAVADVDERLRRAEAKTKLLRKVMGDAATGGGGGDGSVRPAEGVVLAERQVRLKREDGSAGGNIEDFALGRAGTQNTA